MSPAPKTPFQLFQVLQIPCQQPRPEDIDAMKRFLRCRDGKIRAILYLVMAEKKKDHTNPDLALTLEDAEREGAIALRSLHSASRPKALRNINGSFHAFDEQYDTLMGSVRHLFLLLDPALKRRLPAEL
jgi:hypothetical protein